MLSIESPMARGERPVGHPSSADTECRFSLSSKHSKMMPIRCSQKMSDFLSVVGTIGSATRYKCVSRSVGVFGWTA